MSIRVTLGRVAVALVVPVAAIATTAPSGGTPAMGWTLLASPHYRASSVGFAGISCTSPVFCMAVGGVVRSKATEPFTARWDGTAWSAVAAASGAPPGAYLNGVSCVSPSWCVAVGQSTRSLVEQWNGTNWNVVRSVSPGSGGDVLTSVACRARIWCRAVGQSFNTAGQGRTLIEGWDGHRWTRIASPNATTLSNWLESISCITTSSCQAVGFHAVHEGTGRVLQQDLAERWDGHRWTVAPTPDRPTAYNDLFGVSCAAPSSCVAVGHDEVLRHRVATDHAEVEFWNGKLWKLATAPATEATGHSFSGVSCRHHRCTVVGTRRQGRLVRTLVVALGGAGWAAVPSPDRTAGTANALSGVACPTTVVCLAVGFVVAGRIEQTLALRGP